MGYEDESTDGDKGSYEIYKAEGDVLFKQGEFKKASNSYTTALDMRQGDKNCLIARSQCYLELGESDKALADADETLKTDKNYIRGLQQKAEAYYQMGHFEYALMFYHRGKKLRPEVKAFRLGIQKSEEAINNTVGGDAGCKLKNEGDLTFFYAEQQQKQKQKQKGPAYRPVAKKEEKKEKQRPRTSQRDSKTVKQLLGELYADKEYLENLLKETENQGCKSETNMAIRDLAISELEYLDTRTEFWQQQKPMYSRKRDKKMRDSAKQRSGSSGGKRDPTQWILKNLEEIDENQADGKYEESLKKSKRTLKEVEKWSDDDVPNRHEVVANLHSCIGNAYLEMGDHQKALEHHNRDLEIAEQNDIDDAKSRALDNLGRVYARIGKYEKAIEVWEDKLPLSKSALESTWLYHEIGRCHLEMNKYETAKDYGEKSLAAAQEASDDVWCLNATVLIAQSEVKVGELQSALDSFEKALDMAKVQGDKAAESAIKRALEDVNNKIVTGVKDGDDEDDKRDSDRSDTKKGRRDSKDSAKKERRDSNASAKKERRDSNASKTKEDTNVSKGKSTDAHDNKKVKWIIHIYTNDASGTGTDANVHLEVSGKQTDGDEMESIRHDLDNTDNNFESGKVDHIEIEMVNFAKVDHILVGHDNKGLGSGWKLDKVELENTVRNKKYTFDCGRWLADDEDDKKIERELPLTSEDDV